MLKLIKISLSLAIFFSVLSFSQLNANTVSDNNYNNVQPTNFYEDYPENYQEDTIQQLKAQMLLGNPIKVVSDQVDLALASENQMELDIAKEIIKDLEESNEKTALLSKLDNLEADIEATSALVRALDAANYAFESKDQADIDYARQLLEPYKDTYEGDNALYFLDQTEYEINNPQINHKAIAAVEQAEYSKNYENYNYAKQIVLEMEDSSEKQELLNRLDAIDGIQSDSYIDGGKESFEPISHQATLAVEAAEESSSYKDYLYAKDLVDDLPFSLLKTQLLYRLSQIEIVDKVVRLGGTDRINTAILTSQSAYSQADNVILSGFGADVDALTGSLLAAVKDGPMLISRKNKLSPEVEKELDRLNAKKVYLLGGSNAISKNVEEEIKKLGFQVERIGGKNRYETAAKIAKSVKDEVSSHAFIVLGVMENPNDALADALAIGPVSARDKSPVFLVNTNSIPSETRQALTDLKIKSVTIIGGLSVVSPIVSIDLYLSNIQVLRVSGEDRYQTALEIAKKYYPDSNKALIANGRSSADALIGGYLGNLKNAPILLSEKDKLSDNTKTYIKDNFDNAIILGGDAVISSKVEADINKLIK